MLLSTFALLAIASLAAAGHPAQPTYCSKDNLLRAFQHAPTPASRFCATATGYPNFLAIASYPPTRLSSACSCFSRIPTEVLATPSCTPKSKYALSGTDDSYGLVLDIVVTVSTQACGNGGVAITSACGTYNTLPISFISDGAGDPTSNCLIPADGNDFTVVFTANGGDPVELYRSGVWTITDMINSDSAYFPDIKPADVSCTNAAQCPQ